MASMAQEFDWAPLVSMLTILAQGAIAMFTVSKSRAAGLRMKQIESQNTRLLAAAATVEDLKKDAQLRRRDAQESSVHEVVALLSNMEFAISALSGLYLHKSNPKTAGIYVDYEVGSAGWHQVVRESFDTYMRAANALRAHVVFLPLTLREPYEELARLRDMAWFSLYGELALTPDARRAGAVDSARNLGLSFDEGVLKIEEAKPPDPRRAVNEWRKGLERFYDSVRAWRDGDGELMSEGGAGARVDG